MLEWNRKVVKAAGLDPTELSEQFEDCFTRLQEAAGRPIDLQSIKPKGPSILSEVLTRIDEQIAAFNTAFQQHSKNPKDEKTTGEMLRIAYNFADGVKSLMTLIIGISDLKPLIFWLSIDAQFQLADRFAELPFALVGKSKPSLDRYRSVIAAARNRAFHDLFAFGQPFRVRLPAEALRSPELRLFRDFARRREPALDFEDRELVELLEEFTRAPERPLPSGFWEKNLAVMQAVRELGKAVRAAIIAVGS